MEDLPHPGGTLGMVCEILLGHRCLSSGTCVSVCVIYARTTYNAGSISGVLLSLWFNKFGIFLWEQDTGTTTTPVVRLRRLMSVLGALVPAVSLDAGLAGVGTHENCTYDGHCVASVREIRGSLLHWCMKDP